MSHDSVTNINTGNEGVHGILQKNESSTGNDLHRHVGHLKWDEDVIAEHDKDRGTRMKIEEPPTPYHSEDPNRGVVSAAALKACLEQLETNELGQALLDEEIEIKRKQDFERRRKQHYNEFEAKQLAKRIYSDEDVE